jgi:nucleotide-binding universal stress UspA family protein
MVGRSVAEAHWADIFVASVPYQREPILYWDSLVEAVMFESGHGIYLIPAASRTPPELDNILIAWKPTREAARAIAEALPLLKAARNIRLVTIDPDAGAPETPRILEYFKHHGVDIEVLALGSEQKSVPEILLREAHAINAGLIVMGAYGHSRWREWILGGATREIIEKSDIPLLLAH